MRSPVGIRILLMLLSGCWQPPDVQAADFQILSSERESNTQFDYNYYKKIHLIDLKQPLNYRVKHIRKLR